MLFGDYYIVNTHDCCPHCQTPSKRARFNLMDNRGHFECLNCGYTYTTQHGIELDDYKTISGFPYLKSVFIKGRFAECKYYGSIN